MSNIKGFVIEDAQAVRAPLKIAISGGSGGGKTFGALLVARGFSGDDGLIIVIDTEAKRSTRYSRINEIGPFKVLNLTPPFSPERYIEAIEACMSMNPDTIIIDSLTHEWSGEGGIMDSKDKMNVKADHLAWAKLTPRHNKLFQKIINTNCHIISTIRMETSREVQKDDNGKIQIVDVGLKEKQRSDSVYEFDMRLEVSANGNTATCIKDNTGRRLQGAVFERLTVEFGRGLLDYDAELPEIINTIEIEEPQKPPASAPNGQKNEFGGLTIAEQLDMLATGLLNATQAALKNASLPPYASIEEFKTDLESMLTAKTPDVTQEKLDYSRTHREKLIESMVAYRKSQLAAVV